MWNRREICAHIREKDVFYADVDVQIPLPKPNQYFVSIAENVRHSSLTSLPLSEANILVMTEVKKPVVRYARAHTWLLNISCFF